MDEQKTKESENAVTEDASEATAVNTADLQRQIKEMEKDEQ